MLATDLLNQMYPITPIEFNEAMQETLKLECKRYCNENGAMSQIPLKVGFPGDNNRSEYHERSRREYND